VKGATKDNRVGPPKSISSFRDVPVPVEVAAFLAERGRGADTDWVFSDRVGGPKNYRAAHEFMWKPLIRDSGVTPLGMHALRHYAASLVIMEHGVHMLREIFGHHSAAFTYATYGGLLENKAQTMGKIGKLFGSRVSEALGKAG
jgi:integrase